MGLFGRIFGNRETEAQRIERARACIAADEPELVLRILMGIESTDARDLVDLARDKIAERERKAARARCKATATPNYAVSDSDPFFENFRAGPFQEVADAGGSIVKVGGSRSGDGSISISFGPDGSHRIGTSAGSIVFNAPVSDDDGRKRSKDGLAVARRLIEHLANRELEAPAFPFIEAALLAVRAGDTLPACSDERRRRLAAMCTAAAARDHELVLALARGDAELESYVVALVLPFAVEPLAAFAPYNIAMLRALATIDRDRGQTLLAGVPDDRVGEATLVAVDAGLDAEPLRAKWPSLDGMSDEHAHPWRALEVRRLARTDLEAAFTLERELPQRWSHDDDASLAVAARLAKLDPARAIARATELGPDCYHMSWLLGCVRGAPDRAGELVDTWIEHLSTSTYHPYGFFRGVLEACLRLGDAKRVKELCKRGGPTGWQVAHAARWDLGRAENRADLLDALLARYRPGCVAGRARERAGFMTVGMAVTRPRWLELTDPHPVETLSIVAALGPDGPAWGGEALP